VFINGNNPHQLIKTQEPPASQQTHHSIPHNIKVHQNPITASFAYPSPSTPLHHRNLNFGVVFHSHLVPPLNRYLHSSPQWGLTQLSVAAPALQVQPRPQLITEHEVAWMKSCKLLQVTASNPLLVMLLPAEVKSAR
jgi:hypothetical protein